MLEGIESVTNAYKIANKFLPFFAFVITEPTICFYMISQLLNRLLELQIHSRYPKILKPQKTCECAFAKGGNYMADGKNEISIGHISFVG